MVQGKSVWLRAVAPAAVLALALTACGSDDSDDDAAGSAGAEQSETTEESPAAEDEAQGDDAAEPADGGGSATLAEGETSEPVAWEDGDTVADLAVTLDRVHVGTAADLAALNLSSPAEGLVPASIFLSFEHAGGDPLQRPRPGIVASMTLADNAQQTNLVGSPEIPGGCPADSDFVDALAEGETAELCKSVLIPEGSQVASVEWYSGDTDLSWTVG
ncbi:hypothetical protein [Streptomyces radicis]|uniref:Lipoprotein n=1 Tax=Streptomyces radicis TaxID=1750517 RepID=A0A3A9VSV1_9ACTN|nr:hypothetical protein [Streptomyces radicis]RKN03233.1 hypothetical protein D7319_32040 [Streptomyces radicis]RKN13105.1 hypothetical protein D7318_31785 [Streptomyces radicis]